MALSVLDYLHPRGRLNAPVLWPRLSNETKAQSDARAEEIVGAYRTEAYQKAAAIPVGAERDEATRWWVYYRAWDEVYQRLLATPSTVDVTDEGSSSYLLTQMEHIGELAADALAQFEASVEAAVELETEGYGVITSYR